MARGWESKAIADQIEETNERAGGRGLAADEASSPAVRARRERLESLRMSHVRTLDQLGRATTPAHRKMLERTLRALEHEMAELR